MGRLTSLQPRIGTLRTGVQVAHSGDERIRGTSLQIIRKRILTRDKGVCVCARCQLPGSIRRLASIVDHVVPLWAGGRERDDNRQAISAECHDIKNAHESACRASGEFIPWEGGVESSRG